MTELSPAALTVLDAVREICPAPADEIAATALEAMAQTVPISTNTRQNEIRFSILRVAAELRG